MSTRSGAARSDGPARAAKSAAGVATLLALVMMEAGARPAHADDGETRPETYPLSLLVQADALLASQPAPDQDPQDPPGGAAVRLRRVRVGDDLLLGDFHLRALFEGAAETASGAPFPPLGGGRLPIGGAAVRATEVFVGWAPGRACELDAGVLRVPFSLSRQTDEADLRMLERPAFVDAFLPDFRAGVGLSGDLGALAYRAAFLAADPTLETHLFNGGWQAAGRISAEPLGPVGLRPWRRAATDPWWDWFRFAAALSVLYGDVAAPRTLAVDPDFQAQWRNLVVNAEYLLAVRYQNATTVQPGTTQQGAALEPGVTLGDRRIDLTARADWERAANANSWGTGATVTGYAPDPRWRLGAGFERRWAAGIVPGTNTAAYWVIVRLTAAVD